MGYTIESFTIKEDKVDLVAADHVNDLQTSIIAIETALNAIINNNGTLIQGTSFPSPVGSGQLFFRTDQNTVYIRNAANSAWVVIAATSNIQIFTANGTFVAPTGITKVYLTMIGGGGGGSPGDGGEGGGGAGGYIMNYPYTVVPGNSYAVVIGAGGAGGTGGGVLGAAGSASTFDGTVSCAGGGAGNPGVGGGGRDSSTATGGGYNEKGGTGATSAQGKGGGGSPFGAGGNGSTTGPGGTAGANTGAGGGGTSKTGPTEAGGNGGSGLCIVMY